MKDIESCLECENCIYIGEGDYICDEIHEIVVEDFGQPTMYWMLCRRGSMACGTCRKNSRCLERSRKYPCRDYQGRKEEGRNVQGKDNRAVLHPEVAGS